MQLDKNARHQKRLEAIMKVLQGEYWQALQNNKPPGLELPVHLHPPDPADDRLSKRAWEAAMAAWRQNIRCCVFFR